MYGKNIPIKRTIIKAGSGIESYIVIFYTQSVHYLDSVYYYYIIILV